MDKYKSKNFINKLLTIFYKYKKENNIFAFSLIELSIVLIIIGLLIAGITGGASLIESVKIQSLINELTTYKQALYTFKSMKDRLPGDFVGSGFIGYLSGQSYNNNSFGTPYVSGNQDYGLPTTHTGPFVDLYLNKIIDFEPKKRFLVPQHYQKIMVVVHIQKLFLIMFIIMKREYMKLVQHLQNI